MIVCKTCGEQNENGTRFCTNCSSFLEWDGQAVPTGPVPVHLLDRTQPDQQQAPAPAPGTLGTPPPAPPGAPTNDRPPTQPTTVINVPREMLNRPSRGMAGTAPGPTPPPPAPPAAPAGGYPPPAGGYPPPPSAPSPMPPMGGPGYQPYPQQPPASPATGQGPQARMPGAQQPSEPVRRRRRAAPAGTPQPGVAPGEIACRVCGTGNPPDRKFCRTCGTATMQETAPAPERIGFWRRLFGGGNKNRVMEAGTRHDRIRQPAHLVRPIVIIVVIAGLLIVGFGPGRPYIVEGYNLARDRFATQDPVTPSAWSASSSLPNQGPALLGDMLGTTFWAPAKNPTTNGIGDSFTAKFQTPVGRLLYVQIANGASQLPGKDFTNSGRVAQLHVVMTDDLNKTHEATIDLQDIPGLKVYQLPASDIIQITFTISSSYAMSAGKPLAINDVRFVQDKARKYTQGSIK
jgi:RNA polymerase subunit RPABC4/transcription elongation factor Spt4